MKFINAGHFPQIPPRVRRLVQKQSEDFNFTIALLNADGRSTCAMLKEWSTDEQVRDSRAGTESSTPKEREAALIAYNAIASVLVEEFSDEDLIKKAEEVIEKVNEEGGKLLASSRLEEVEKAIVEEKKKEGEKKKKAEDKKKGEGNNSNESAVNVAATAGV